MATTTQLRQMYSPACRPGVSFAPAYAALDACFKKHNYQIRKNDTGARNCRAITGGSGYSLHAYFGDDSFTFWTDVTIPTALAVDVNWLTNPYGPRLITDMPRAMIDDIYKIRTNSGAQVWGWGGYYRGNKDAMHFEVVCSPADLRSGINKSTVPGAAPPPPPISQETEDMSVAIIKGNSKPEWFLWDLGRNKKRWIENRTEALYLAQCGAKAAEYEGLKVAPFSIDQGFVDGIPKE